MSDNPEEKLINEIKEKYKNTYANAIYHLVQKIDFLKEQNKDLDRIIKILKEK